MVKTHLFVGFVIMEDSVCAREFERHLPWSSLLVVVVSFLGVLIFRVGALPHFQSAACLPKLATKKRKCYLCGK